MTTELPQFIAALINWSIEDSQSVSALSAGALTGAKFSAQSSNDIILKVFTYSQVSSIVKRCEKSKRDS